MKSKKSKNSKKISNSNEKFNIANKFFFTEEDLSKENILEGAIIRPLILMGSFFSFLGAMFLIMVGSKGNFNLLKWGGSLLIFSFILNLQSIFSSLTDKTSIFRTYNLVFKITLFIAEIVFFNWFGIVSGLYTLFSF